MARLCTLSACEFATRHVDALDPGALYETICDIRDWFWSDPDRHAEWRQDLRAASAEIVHLGLARIGYEVEPSLARSIGDHYRDLRDESLALYSGAVETLQRLRERGRPHTPRYARLPSPGAGEGES